MKDINKEIELLQKVKAEVEESKEVLEVERLQIKISKERDRLETVKQLIKVSEVELNKVLEIVNSKLSSEVYEYLYGTVQKTVNSAKIPKLDSIKMMIVKKLLEGKTVVDLSKEVYPDRLQDKETYFLIYRQVQEVEKDNCIKIIQKPQAKNNYTDIKIEKIGTW